jgi:hypothetical protein
MIDHELDQLSRALIAATDRLNSEDFRERQERFLALEAERNTLAESLEADEAAVVSAQEALQRHVMGGNTQWPPLFDDQPADVIEETVDVEQYFRPHFGEPATEFETAKANGAIGD